VRALGPSPEALRADWARTHAVWLLRRSAGTPACRPLPMLACTGHRAPGLLFSTVAVVAPSNGVQPDSGRNSEGSAATQPTAGRAPARRSRCWPRAASGGEPARRPAAASATMSCTASSTPW
jgi:hypothetical protein